MFPLKVGKSYTCSKTVKIDGAVWFEVGKHYVLKDMRTGQGEVELSFSLGGSNEVFTFQAISTDANFLRVVDSLIED